MTGESIAVLDYYTAALSHTPADFSNSSEGWDSFCSHWGAELYFEVLPDAAGTYLSSTKWKVQYLWKTVMCFPCDFTFALQSKFYLTNMINEVLFLLYTTEFSS